MQNQYPQSSRSFLPGRGEQIPPPPHTYLGISNDDHHEQAPPLSPFIILKNLSLVLVTLLVAVGAITIILILYVVIRPFSLPAYRRLACTIAVASFLDAMALILPNTKIYLTGDSDPLTPVGISVLVCNHVMNGDWWVILMLARCVGLKGSVKAFLQHRVPAIPNDGLTLLSHGSNGKNLGNLNLSRNPSHPTFGASGGGGAAAAALSSSNTDAKPNQHAPVMMSSNASQRNLRTLAPLTSSSSTFHPKQCFGTTFLNKFLDFPLLSSENAQNYVQERNELFSLLRSFASTSTTVPVHLLLFPEGCPEGDDRKSMIAKSVEFAKRDGRPQLKHLLLPRTTGFYASLESLREASTVVYDVTMAYRGFDSQAPFSCDVSFETLIRLIQGKVPNEVHIRIKRYSIGEVLSDANWLDKQWSEKDRLLDHFERHGMFPTDNRGFCRHILMNSRGQSVESSLGALLRLGLIPFAIPFILLLSVPLLWVVGWLWIASKTFSLLFPGVWGDMLGSAVSVAHGHHDAFRDEKVGGGGGAGGSVGGGGEASVTSHDGGSDSAFGTPFFPATPFASPPMWQVGHPNDERMDEKQR
eukprot:CAMPEP_0176493136 /NCGR_PEP_ID=MMETSP0200_2-20121128/9393_1 /TAXON_ID=947934 /ORGANISM="Chaetoceros sp., Strain GSL56" /LENGTH=583 /DNA_ID=CAMNT_0017890789 /DNA_START=27 /DNA_END=1776 /DNA_ORIENTATION=-